MRLDCSLGRGVTAQPSAWLRASQEQREVQDIDCFYETRTSRINGAAFAAIRKCNINYSPADLPPRLLMRYAQVVSVSNLRTADAREENAARIANSLTMATVPGTSATA